LMSDENAPVFLDRLDIYQVVWPDCAKFCRWGKYLLLIHY
jgi:hypothetical protein